MKSSNSLLAAPVEWLVTSIDSENKLEADAKLQDVEGWVLVICVLIVYAVVLSIFTRWMTKRNPMDLHKFRTVWNINLSLCSALGILAVVPETLQILGRDDGFHTCICELEQLKTQKFQGWITYFGYLKLLELGDSLLEVLEKKPLTYLHIHHHLSMLGATHTIVFHFPVFRLLAASELVIKFLLYACLALEDSGWISKTVLNFTAGLQAFPRAVMLASCFYSFKMKFDGRACDVPTVGLVVVFVAALLYFSKFSRSFNYFCNEETRVSKHK